jgi:hypothetical protein
MRIVGKGVGCEGLRPQTRAWLHVYNHVLCNSSAYERLRASYTDSVCDTQGTLLRWLWAAGVSRGFGSRVRPSTFRKQWLPLLRAWFSVLCDPRLCVRRTEDRGFGLFVTSNCSSTQLPAICGYYIREAEAAAARLREEGHYCCDEGRFMCGPASLLNYDRDNQQLTYTAKRGEGTMHARFRRPQALTAGTELCVSYGRQFALWLARQQ